METKCIIIKIYINIIPQWKGGGAFQELYRVKCSWSNRSENNYLENVLNSPKKNVFGVKSSQRKLNISI